MIEGFIFYFHVVFFVYVFAKTYIEEKLTGAFLSTIFVIIIFSVGWTFSAFLIALIIPPDGLTRVLTRAAFSLAFLTIIEAVFYKFFYWGKQRETSNVKREIPPKRDGL